MIASVVAVVPALVLCGMAAAHFDPTSTYTQRACPAALDTRVDPINVVFHAWGTWGRVVNQIEAHAGWTVATGSTQVFVDHETCRPQHAQRASGLGSRFHVRVRGQHPDPVLGWTAVGAVHHEDLVLFPFPCGHAVDSNGSRGSGYDRGRDELRDRFADAGHTWNRVWWGNTQSFKQCDGDYAGSDGWTLEVALHQVNH
jgi:hypothetical protein